MDIEIYADTMEVTISSRPDCHLQILPPRLMDLWLDIIGELGIEQPFGMVYCAALLIMNRTFSI
ncbi:hypothetical protein CKY10_00955 [Photorhabdus sp. HUG-39]|nr:hypothetical protein CKY10_00955 [Photorhabdus sp. HUG-39]